MILIRYWGIGREGEDFISLISYCRVVGIIKEYVKGEY